MLLFVASLGAFGAGDESRPLFENGRSAWVVVIERDAARPVRYAAEEFVRTVRKISGTTIGIVDDGEMPRCNFISIRSEGESLVDRFDWRSEPGKIFLRGNSPRGALFATYAFLRDNLGCRWYWPGDSGEFLPSLVRFDVGEGERSYEGGFDIREMSICTIWRHRHEDTERWMAKVFLNAGINTPEIRDDIGALRIVSDHYIALPDGTANAKFFAEHADWYSLMDGQRSPQGIAGCWSNEEYFHYTVTNLIRIIREGNIDIANFFAADVPWRCECANCTKEPDRSSRFWNFYGRVISEIRKELPDQRFAGLAYQEYRAIPSCDIPDLEYVEYCQYNRCYLHRLDDAGCSHNVTSMREFRAWCDKAPMALYGYESDVFNVPLQLPYAGIFADEMRVFQDMGLKRVKTEYSVTLDRLTGADALPREKIQQLSSRLAHYLWASLAFDPRQDVMGLVSDFCEHVYGSGAESMRAYHTLLAEAWERDRDFHLTYFGNTPRNFARRFVTSDLCRRAESLLAAARSAAEDDARAVSEIELDRACFRDWLLALGQSVSTLSVTGFLDNNEGSLTRVSETGRLGLDVDAAWFGALTGDLIVNGSRIASCVAGTAVPYELVNGSDVCRMHRLQFRTGDGRVTTRYVTLVPDAGLVGQVGALTTDAVALDARPAGTVRSLNANATEAVTWSTLWNDVTAGAVVRVYAGSVAEASCLGELVRGNPREEGETVFAPRTLHLKPGRYVLEHDDGIERLFATFDVQGVGFAVLIR